MYQTGGRPDSRAASRRRREFDHQVGSSTERSPLDLQESIDNRPSGFGVMSM